MKCLTLSYDILLLKPLLVFFFSYMEILIFSSAFPTASTQYSVTMPLKVSYNTAEKIDFECRLFSFFHSLFVSPSEQPYFTLNIVLRAKQYVSIFILISFFACVERCGGSCWTLKLMELSRIT